MANRSQLLGRRRDAGTETGNPRTDKRQPIGGGAIFCDDERIGRLGSQVDASQQSDADGDGPSSQTSTASDEEGQL